MQCLQCGVEMALLQKLRNATVFCSEECRRTYQDESNQLAISRLRQHRRPRLNRNGEGGVRLAPAGEPPLASYLSRLDAATIERQPAKAVLSWEKPLNGEVYPALSDDLIRSLLALEFTQLQQRYTVKDVRPPVLTELQPDLAREVPTVQPPRKTREKQRAIEPESALPVAAAAAIAEAKADADAEVMPLAAKRGRKAGAVDTGKPPAARSRKRAPEPAMEVPAQEVPAQEVPALAVPVPEMPPTPVARKRAKPAKGSTEPAASTDVPPRARAPRRAKVAAAAAPAPASAAVVPAAEALPPPKADDLQVMPAEIETAAPAQRERPGPVSLAALTALWRRATARQRAAATAGLAAVGISLGGWLGTSGPKPPAAPVSPPSLTAALGPGVLAGSWEDGRATDAAGAARERRFSLHRESKGARDYVVEFEAARDKGALGWVVRAQDGANYYAFKLEPEKAGGAQLVRFAVVQGKEEQITRIPVAVWGKETAGLYRIRVEAKGTKIRTLVNGKEVDLWEDARLARGAAGFAQERGEQSVIEKAEFSLTSDMARRQQGGPRQSGQPL